MGIAVRPTSLDASPLHEHGPIGCAMNIPKPHRHREPLPSPLADRVLFIDGEALVIDKPAGLPVDPPRDGSLSMENHLAGLTFGFARWPVLVHRLDRDTSGCLLLARNPKSAARFTAAFEGAHGREELSCRAGRRARDGERHDRHRARQDQHARGGLAHGAGSQGQGSGDALAGARCATTAARWSASRRRPAARISCAPMR